jgi:hypothetical protein
MIRPNVTPRDSHGNRAWHPALTVVLLAAALLAACPAAAASKIYRTVDEDGNVVFTDVPPKSGEQGRELDLEAPNSFEPGESQDTRRSVESWLGESDEVDDPSQGQRSAVASYRSLKVASPANDAPLRDNAGTVTVTAAVEPDLDPSHAIQVYLDGKLHQSGQTTAFQLTEVDRGTHSVQLRIVDQSGNTIATSDPSTFHLQRRSVLLQPARSSN